MTNPKKKVPLGKPLNWNDKDSKITPKNIKSTKATIKEISPLLSDLLDAKVIKGTEKKKKPK